jgi:hypothetical protein
MQYAQVFNHLCQYAGYHADNDARKRDHFRRGLNTKLKERLNLVKAENFNELVNMAITQEDCISATEQRRKGRHLVDLQLHNRQGVGWFKTLLPEHHLEVTCLVDG